jgi:UDP-N-acetylmuramate dehydrogenase
LSNRELQEIFDKGLFRGEIKFDELLSKHTSLRIGGPADILVFPEDAVSLKNVFKAAQKEMIPVFVMGAGTNLLISDEGMGGIVVSMRAFKNIEIIRNAQNIVPEEMLKNGSAKPVALFVESGKTLAGVLEFAREHGLSGIEQLAGIPGTFGGALSMNAGSFGVEIKDVVLSVALMRMDGEIVVMDRSSLEFFYRGSNIPEDDVILSGNILLGQDSKEKISEQTREYSEKKRSTQPLGKASAGCVFKNPAGISAGRLIEESGCKGMTVGDVEVSTVHANYFINKGQASCRDFLKLMNEVRGKVKESSGVTLEHEIRIVGRAKETIDE